MLALDEQCRCTSVCLTAKADCRWICPQHRLHLRILQGCCLLLLPTVLMTIVIIVLAGWRQKVTLLAVVLGSCILWPLLRLMKHNEWMEFNEDRFYSLPQDPEETMLLVPGTVWRED